MTIIAIDPGKSGGIALSGPNRMEKTLLPGSTITTESMPDNTGGLVRALSNAYQNRIGQAVAYVENVPKFCGPKLPGSVIFPMAENFGAVQGILAALGIRTILVRPQDWQAGLGIGTRSKSKDKADWKRKLKAEAQRRFPQLNVTLATADALLILDYAIRQERNNNTVNLKYSDRVTIAGHPEEQP